MKGSDHSSTVHRLKRVEGQVRGILKMVEEEVYCVDILNQIKAAKSALTKVENEILGRHLDHCVRDSFKSKNSDQITKKIDEVLKILERAGG